MTSHPAIGFLTYVVTNAYQNIALGLVQRKNARLFLRGVRSRTSLRLAASVTAYSIAYRALYRALLPEFSLRPSAGLPAFLAGALASLALTIEPAGRWRQTIVIYLLTRALVAGWRAVARLDGMGGTQGQRQAEQASWLHKTGQVMRQGRWWCGPHLVFGAANAILLHCFVFAPHAFPSGYLNFILSLSRGYTPTPSPQSPSPRAVVDTLAKVAAAGWPALPSSLATNAVGHPASSITRVDLSPAVAGLINGAHPLHTRMACALLHPADANCGRVARRQVFGAGLKGARFFAVVAGLGALVGWKKTAKSPLTALLRAVIATLQSSAFVSLSISTGWATICLFQRFLPPGFLPQRRFLLQGFLAGLWVHLAGPSARVADLAAYGLRLAIECGWKEAVAAGRVRGTKRGELAVLALSLGTLMAVYETDREALGSRLVGTGLDQVAGPLPGYEGDSDGKGKDKRGTEQLDWDTRGVVFSPGLL